MTQGPSGCILGDFSKYKLGRKSSFASLIGSCKYVSLSLGGSGLGKWRQQAGRRRKEMGELLDPSFSKLSSTLHFLQFESVNQWGPLFCLSQFISVWVTYTQRVLLLSVGMRSWQLVSAKDLKIPGTCYALFYLFAKCNRTLTFHSFVLAFSGCLNKISNNLSIFHLFSVQFVESNLCLLVLGAALLDVIHWRSSIRDTFVYKLKDICNCHKMQIQAASLHFLVVLIFAFLRFPH